MYELDELDAAAAAADRRQARVAWAISLSATVAVLAASVVMVLDAV